MEHKTTLSPSTSPLTTLLLTPPSPSPPEGGIILYYRTSSQNGVQRMGVRGGRDITIHLLMGCMVCGVRERKGARGGRWCGVLGREDMIIMEGREIR